MIMRDANPYTDLSDDERDALLAARTDDYHRADHAATLLNALITHNPFCDRDAYARDDRHDLAMTDLRMLLIDPDYDFAHDDDDPCFAPSPDRDELRDHARTLITLATQPHPIASARESLTSLALSFSLCPMHLIDYAICFDDEFPECAAIRAMHPSHDT